MEPIVERMSKMKLIARKPLYYVFDEIPPLGESAQIKMDGKEWKICHFKAGMVNLRERKTGHYPGCYFELFVTPKEGAYVVSGYWDGLDEIPLDDLI